MICFSIIYQLIFLFVFYIFNITHKMYRKVSLHGKGINRKLLLKGMLGVFLVLYYCHRYHLFDIVCKSFYLGSYFGMIIFFPVLCFVSLKFKLLWNKLHKKRKVRDDSTCDVLFARPFCNTFQEIVVTSPLYPYLNILNESRKILVKLSLYAAS